jgi:hypothetical protein
MGKCEYCGKEVSGNIVFQAGEKIFCNNLCQLSFEKTAKTTKSTKKISVLIGAITVAIIAIIVGHLTTGFLQGDFENLTKYSAPDKSFTLMLPKNVEETKQVVNTPLGPINIYFFEAKAKHHVFTVAFSDYPPSFIETNDTKTLLDGSRDGAVRNIQGQLLSETFIDFKGHSGRELRILGPQKIILKMRIYLVGNRLYQIMTVAEPDYVYDKIINTVFDSFKINSI